MPRTEVRGGQILDATVSLTADVTGVLPILNGGTGSTTDTKVTADGILVVKKLTQAAYDALGAGVVATTLYVIVG